MPFVIGGVSFFQDRLNHPEDRGAFARGSIHNRSEIRLNDRRYRSSAPLSVLLGPRNDTLVHAQSEFGHRRTLAVYSYVRLTAVRRLAAEAADNGLLDPALAAAIGFPVRVPSDFA